MARPRLRRWHVDVACFLGLTLFVCCYWYHTPAPRWIARIPTDPTINMSASTLGFSTDGQSFFTIKDCTIVGNRLPQPMIQRWNTLTGELQAKYSLQMTAEDIARIKLGRTIKKDQSLGTAKVPEFDVMYTVHQIDGFAPLHRYYNLLTGECINRYNPLLIYSDFWYLEQNPIDGHHWGCYLRSREPNEPLHIQDLSTCTTIHTIPSEPNRNVQATLLSPDGQYLFIVWGVSGIDRKTVPDVLDIYRPGTWDHLQRITLPLQPIRASQIAVTHSDHLVIRYMQRPVIDWQLTTLRFRLHRQTHTLEQDGEIEVHPCSSYSSMSLAFSTVFIDQQLHHNTRPLTEPLLTIHNYLLRYGLSLVRTRPTLECRVADLTDGQLLRQLRVTGFTYAPVSVSPTGHYLAGLQTTETPTGSIQHSLWMYDIPHHLREPTLRWLMYLSWLLILPWPLRYLLRPGRN
ncbi:MAG: hypothetical protein U0796_04820 [Gemmatales bacterium]